jgi:hypothetical protein
MADDLPDDVSEEMKILVNHAVYVRGTIISSYAHIEFLLADLCLKAWEMPEYAHLAGSFPYKIETRLKAAGKLFEADGPLRAYRSGVQAALDELLQLEDLRHFVAHGLMILTPTPPDSALVEYRLYRTTREGPTLVFYEVPLSELEDTGTKISGSLNQMLITFNRIYSDLDFELRDQPSAQ